MDLSFNTLNSLLIRSFRDERELCQHVVKLKECLTTSRKQKLQSYAQSNDLVSAYTCLYMPTNIPKLHYIMKLLPQDSQKNLLGCEIIDIGTGPGTYLLAFAQLFKDLNVNMPMHGIEKSPLMREQARKILDHYFPERKISLHDHYLRIPHKGQYPRLVFFGHSLNEMSIDEAMKIIKDLEANYVFFLEPGTKEVFTQILSVRSKMNENQFHSLYPCPDLTYECPLTKIPGDWCHQIATVSHNPSIERICQMLHMDRKKLPFTAHIYSKQETSHRIQGRLIRVRDETKSHFVFDICDCHQERITLEVAKSAFSKEERKRLEELQTGIELHYDIEKHLQGGKARGIIHLA